MADLLRCVGTFEAAAVARPSAREFFRVTPEEDRATTPVVIGTIISMFETLMANVGDGKSVSAATLCSCTLPDGMSCYDAIRFLGSWDKVGAELAHFQQVLTAQGRGQQGVLSKSGINVIPICGDAVALCIWVDCYSEWTLSASGDGIDNGVFANLPLSNARIIYRAS